jgi:hypothetical protein
MIMPKIPAERIEKGKDKENGKGEGKIKEEPKIKPKIINRYNTRNSIEYKDEWQER